MIGWLELECACTYPGCERRVYVPIPVTARRLRIDGEFVAVLTLPDMPTGALCRVHLHTKTP